MFALAVVVLLKTLVSLRQILWRGSKLGWKEQHNIQGRERASDMLIVCKATAGDPKERLFDLDRHLWKSQTAYSHCHFHLHSSLRWFAVRDHCVFRKGSWRYCIVIRYVVEQFSGPIKSHLIPSFSSVYSAHYRHSQVTLFIASKWWKMILSICKLCWVPAPIP